jgi:hypothetical protein
VENIQIPVSLPEEKPEKKEVKDEQQIYKTLDREREASERRQQ